MNIIICSELHLVKYSFRIRIWNDLAIALNLAIWRYEFNGRKEPGPESIFHSMYVCVNCTAT